MIKRLLTLAAAVAALAFGANAATYPLSLEDLGSGWDSSYDPETKTITYDDEWRGRGWWFESDGVGADFSAYDEIVIETEDNTIGYQIVVEYTNATGDNDNTVAQVPAGRLKGVCVLNSDLKNGVKQIYLQGMKAGTLTLKAAYLQSTEVVDPSEPVVLWEGEQAIDWWGAAVDLMPADFIAANTVAGDILKIEYTAEEGNAFKIVWVNKEWANDLLPLITTLEGYNAEYGIVPLPTDGVYEMVIDEENAAIFTNNAEYQTFKFCGDKVTLTKIVLIHEAGEQGDSEWSSLITGGNAADGTSECIIDNNTWGPASVVDAPGDVKAFGINIKADCAEPYESQVFIKAIEPIAAGTKVRLSFDYYCTDTRTIGMQIHAAPGSYLYWGGFGEINATTEWKSYSKEVEVTADMSPEDNMQTVAFNLATESPAATFYITNVKFEKYTEGGQGGFTEITVDENAPVEYFNLQGIRVANPESGLYIRRQGNKTTKVIVK